MQVTDRIVNIELMFRPSQEGIQTEPKGGRRCGQSTPFVFFPVSIAVLVVGHEQHSDQQIGRNQKMG